MQNHELFSSRQQMDPIRDGGLGIQRVSSLALPAFLASATGSLPLQGITLLNVALQPHSLIASYLSQ